MTNGKALPGIGDIQIELGGEELFLRPTLGAALALSRQTNGLVGLIRRCETLDFDTIIMIVAQGIGQKGQGSKDLPEMIYKAGIGFIAAQCINYIGILANGGKPPISNDGGENKEEVPLEK